MNAIVDATTTRETSAAVNDRKTLSPAVGLSDGVIGICVAMSVMDLRDLGGVSTV
jgi:hypothetical protein